MSYRVVIPSRNQENALACLSSIRENQPDAWTTVVVDESPEWPDMGLMVLQEATEAIRGVKPFCFSRNVNMGARRIWDVSCPQPEHSRDLIILNDDTRLLTPDGFSALSKAANDQPQYGVVSAAITDAVGNPEQMYDANWGEDRFGRGSPHCIIRPALHHTLVFVCVYIRADVLNQIGLLDESFTAYGYDDNDYCLRARRAGLALGIFDGCVVEHGQLPSTYRSAMPDGIARLDDLAPNRSRFIEKWGLNPEDA